MNLSPTALHRTSWGIRVFLALAIGGAGSAMLLAIPPMVELFERIGIGQWFRVLTGALELLGALLLVIPATGFLGALLLLALMLGGIVTHCIARSTW